MAEKSKKVSLSLTLSGILFLWGALGLFAGGLFFSSGVVACLGLIGMFLISLARFLVSKPLENLHLQRAIPSRALVADRIEVKVVAVNRSCYFGIPETAIRDRLFRQSTTVPPLGFGGKKAFSYSSALFHRGRQDDCSFEITCSWPFGLFCASTEAEFEPLRRGDETILVAPRPLIPRFLDHILNQIEVETVLFSEWQPEDPTEFRSLREYRAGDPLRSIHWPSSTRNDRLLVRESDPPLPRPRQYGLLLHQWLPAGELIQPEKFEKMLRIASGLVTRFRSRGISIVVEGDLGLPEDFTVDSAASFHRFSDWLSLARAKPTSSLEILTGEYQRFGRCDQVFVLGCWPHSDWGDAVNSRYGSLILLDSDTGTMRRAETVETES